VQQVATRAVGKRGAKRATARGSSRSRKERCSKNPRVRDLFGVRGHVQAIRNPLHSNRSSPPVRRAIAFPIPTRYRLLEVCDESMKSERRARKRVTKIASLGVASPAYPSSLCITSASADSSESCPHFRISKVRHAARIADDPMRIGVLSERSESKDLSSCNAHALRKFPKDNFSKVRRAARIARA
jgi:hypothetical protein